MPPILSAAGVDVRAGGIILGAGSTASTVGGEVTSGALGTGLLTMGADTRLMINGTSRAVANAVEFEGNVTFDNTDTGADTLSLERTDHAGESARWRSGW